MGCGQSKIHLYPRKSKSKANGKKSGHVDVDADADEEEGHTGERDKEINKDKEKIDDEHSLSDGKGSPEPPNGEINVPILRPKNVSLLQSQDISSSQQNFFRMLDQKIEEGPDYDSASETEMALEEARLNALVQHWESASITASMCSSTSRSLQSTPVRQVPMRQPPQLRSQQQQQQQQHQLLSAELLSQQQQLKQNISPKRDGRTLLSQTIIHQTYGVAQQGGGIVTQNTRQSRVGMVSGILGSGSGGTSSGTSPLGMNIGGVLVPTGSGSAGGNLQGQHLQMAYYSQQPPPQSYFGEMLHPLQVPQTSPEPRFPPAISVQRLAPQVQRQIRETQELIKDSCPQLYAAGYGSPGPPLRAQQRAVRRPTLETQYSQELS